MRRWSSVTPLFLSAGATTTVARYLAEKATEEVYRPPKSRAEFQLFLSQVEASETSDFKFPFKVFTSTLVDLLTTNGGSNNHERNWPLSCWHESYEHIAQMLDDLATSIAQDRLANNKVELQEIIHLPIFVLAAARNPRLNPVSEAGPGKSKWGVYSAGQTGYVHQQRFWAPKGEGDGGPHSWRILAGGEMFSKPGNSDFTVFKAMLRSANALYSAFQPSVIGQLPLGQPLLSRKVSEAYLQSSTRADRSLSPLTPTPPNSNGNARRRWCHNETSRSPARSATTPLSSEQGPPDHASGMRDASSRSRQTVGSLLPEVSAQVSSPTPSTPPAGASYRFLISAAGVERAALHLERLRAGEPQGSSFQGVLRRMRADIGDTRWDILSQSIISQLLQNMKPIDLVRALVQTKVPKIPAERGATGEGIDWTCQELSILGDVSVAVPVTIFDDGSHVNPMLHSRPFSGTLIYTSGALLAPAQRAGDWAEVVGDSARLSTERFCRLYERRLAPCFQYANDAASSNGNLALITVPGLGCGHAAGPFQGSLGRLLGVALEKILISRGGEWGHIKAVYYDYAEEEEGVVERKRINGIEYIIQPSRVGGSECRQQLCVPQSYESAFGAARDDLAGCELFSLAAWDPASWPGDESWLGSRASDASAKASASDSMYRITGVQGSYDASSTMYLPPAPYRDWNAVIEERGVVLDTSTLEVPLDHDPHDHAAAEAERACLLNLLSRQLSDSWEDGRLASAIHSYRQEMPESTGHASRVGAQTEEAAAPSTPSSPEAILISSALQASESLRELAAIDDETIRRLIGVARQVSVPPGSALMEERDEVAEHLYVVEDGVLDVRVGGREPQDRPSVLRRGDVFGEVSLLCFAPSEATIKARTDSVLWAVHRSDFDKLIVSVSERRVNERLCFMNGVDGLRQLPESHKVAIAQMVREGIFVKGDQLVTRGERSGWSYILCDGEVVLDTEADGSSGQTRASARSRLHAGRVPPDQREGFGRGDVRPTYRPGDLVWSLDRDMWFRASVAEVHGDGALDLVPDSDSENGEEDPPTTNTPVASARPVCRRVEYDRVRPVEFETHILGIESLAYDRPHSVTVQVDSESARILIIDRVIFEKMRHLGCFGQDGVVTTTSSASAGSGQRAPRSPARSSVHGRPQVGSSTPGSSSSTHQDLGGRGSLQRPAWRKSKTDSGRDFWWHRGPDSKLVTVFDDPTLDEDHVVSGG